MPETTNFMILGFAIVLIILFALIGYMVLKVRNLRTELKMLESLEAEEQVNQVVPTTTPVQATKS